jgi:general secretion pathway protein D
VFRWQRTSSIVLGSLLVVVVATTSGCATQGAAREGKKAVNHRNWDAAVYYYLEALANEPDNIEYQMALIHARQKAGQEHFKRGTAFEQIGNLTAARNEYRLAVQLDPTHQFADQRLRDVEADLRVLARPDGQRELEEIKARAREAKVKPPILDPKSKEPITLNFPKAKPVGEIYEAMGKAYGFNVLFDPKLKKEDKLSIELNDVTAARALEIVMQSAGHFYKVLDEHSIIIAEDNPQNRRDYEDLVIKTFFLSNAEVKEVDKLLRSLIEARRLSTNEQLNAITLRDTADKVAIAEKLIAANDKAKAEVLVDVELLEIKSTLYSTIGANLSSSAFAIALDESRVAETRPEGGGLYLPDVKDIFHTGAWSVVVPDLAISLAKSTTEAKSLAQPQMRITEGEKGSLVLGDRVPIPVTSFNTQYQGSAGVIPVTSFQYQDVGIKIDVEPRVHHNREVTLKVTVEVSKVSGSVKSETGPDQPVIGTRTITTVIRLKDGETNMLVGLYKEEESKSDIHTPGLSKIPILGRLFKSRTTDGSKTDLVLTLTPHIIRFPDIEEEDLAPLWVGTEARISYFGSASPRVHSGRASRGPFEGQDEPETPEEYEERPPDDTETDEGTSPFHSRRPTRGRQTPRPEVPEPPRGVDLVPSQGGSKSLVIDDSDEESEPDPASRPLDVRLEPSVLSLGVGQQRMLQLVVTGGADSYGIPVGLSFDADRLTIRDVEVADGASLSGHELDESKGWLVLDLVVDHGSELPRAIATITVEGREPGPVPLLFASTEAVGTSGDIVPVVTNDAAVFVVTDAAEEP